MGFELLGDYPMGEGSRWIEVAPKGAPTKLILIGPPKPQTPHAPDEWILRLGTLPLMHQPGEKWMYNTGADVLGVLIARASGQELETFFRERLFEPLGIKDTGFSVPAAKLDRLASCYQADPETGALELHDGVDDSQWGRPPAFPAGREERTIEHDTERDSKTEDRVARRMAPGT